MRSLAAAHRPAPALLAAHARLKELGAEAFAELLLEAVERK